MILTQPTEEGALPGAKTKIRRHSLLITFGNQWNPRAKKHQTSKLDWSKKLSIYSELLLQDCNLRLKAN